MSKRHFQIGPGVECDIDRLVSTRLLVQANSGGGKSWAIRRLLEQTHGKVQQIVIDPEGEFASLRERFDYVLAARQGGDTLADARTAKLLAERVLELGVSTIADIYELYPGERIRFVKLFLEALVNAPKALWHPVLIVLDEAHTFCPEKDEAESASAVKALCSLGRKRGFCAVLATQRLSKLAKDAAAECNNKLIGRTSLDVDMARAGDELGFSKGDRLALRDLNDGQFFAFGPALTRSVTKVTVGPVQTTHPKAGSHLAAVVPPPTDKVKALLPKLSDLPAEAEAREKSVADLKRDNANLRRELTDAKKAQPTPKAERVDVQVLTDADRELLKVVEDRLVQVMDEFQQRERLLLVRVQEDIEKACYVHDAALASGLGTAARLLDKKGFQKILDKLAAVKAPVAHAPVKREQGLSPRIPARSPVVRPATQAASVNGSVLPAQQRILNGLAFLQGIGVTPADKTQLALIVGVSPTSGGYFNNLGALRSAGYIEYPTGGTVGLTGAGAAIASSDGVPTTTDELHEAVKAKLPPAKWRIIEALIEAYPHGLTKDTLAEKIDVSPTSGGYFNNLGSLRSLGLLDYPQPGTVIARPVLFLD